MFGTIKRLLASLQVMKSFPVLHDHRHFTDSRYRMLHTCVTCSTTASTAFNAELSYKLFMLSSFVSFVHIKIETSSIKRLNCFFIFVFESFFLHVACSRMAVDSTLPTQLSFSLDEFSSFVAFETNMPLKNSRTFIFSTFKSLNERTVKENQGKSFEETLA